MIEITPAQVSAIHIRMTAACTDIRISKWQTIGRTIEASFFARQRLIETMKIGPSGIAKELP